MNQQLSYATDSVRRVTTQSLVPQQTHYPANLEYGLSTVSTPAMLPPSNLVATPITAPLMTNTFIPPAGSVKTTTHFVPAPPLALATAPTAYVTPVNATSASYVVNSMPSARGSLLPPRGSLVPQMQMAP